MRMLNDSNTNWLGNIPAEWSIGRIGQLYSERRVKVSDTEYMPLSVTMKGVVPQLSTAAKTDAHDDRKLVRKGDFAINSRSDRRGSCGISEYDGSVSLINTILAPRKSMSPRYYNWLFHPSEFAAEFYKWGHGIVDDLWTTNWNDMKRILVPVPSLLEQERIADFVDRKCADIDNVLLMTKTSIKEYKKLKQSVITEAVTKGIRGERPMKDSGIEWVGEIPEDWGKDKIVRLFKTIGSGTTPKSSKDSSFKGSVNWIQSGDINGGLLNSCKNTINEDALNEYSALKVYRSPFIIMAMYGASIGNISISTIDGCVNQACCVMSDSEVDSHYVFYALKSSKDYLVYKANGGGQPNISQETLKQLWIPKPPTPEQQEIATFLDKKCSEIDSLIASKEKFITELESYKKSLIYEYVTGKKEVPSNA